jgi:isoquinoline 1-oxidoreductase subunit alpha
MALFNLKINGKSYKADVDGNTPLLWVLRDHLDLVGTKYGCGIAMCGACTVHINGEQSPQLRDYLKQPNIQYNKLGMK